MDEEKLKSFLSLKKIFHPLNVFGTITIYYIEVFYGNKKNHFFKIVSSSVSGPSNYNFQQKNENGHNNSEYNYDANKNGNDTC